MTTITTTVPQTAKTVRGTRMRKRLSQIALIASVLVLWHVAAVAGGIGAVPTPIDVGGALLGLVGSGAIWMPVLDTLLAWAVSFVIAAVIALPIGFMLGASTIVYRLTVLLLDFFRTVPALALVPLAIILYGAGLGSTVLLAVFGATWAILMQTIYGVRDVDPVARDTIKSFRVRRIDVVFRLIIPTAAPYIATGFRIAAAVTLLLTLSAEIIIPAPGIGEQIVIAQLGGAIPEMYAYILITGLIGVAINAGFVWLERRALSWHPSHRPEVFA